MLIDSHCHLADDAFAGDALAVIDRARAAGVAAALCVLDANSDAEMARAVPLRAAWPALHVAVGVHPHQAGRFDGRAEEAAGIVAARLADAAIGAVAVGEIGLDYHYDFAPRAVQREVFAAQLALARTRDLPVIIHAREADEDVIDVIREAGHHLGVFHCFTGDWALARRALDLGFHVSFAGIVTFPKAAALRDVARAVPDDRLLVETDSPYLAPIPHRGKRNEPAWVARVAEVVAEVRTTAAAEVSTLTGRNFLRLFGVPEPPARVDSPDGLC